MAYFGLGRGGVLLDASGNGATAVGRPGGGNAARAARLSTYVGANLLGRHLGIRGWGDCPRRRCTTSPPRQRAAAARRTGAGCRALLLAITRPFEGLIVCLLVASWVAYRWTRQGWPAWRVLVTRAVVPQLVLLAMGAAMLASYNMAVTGSPTKMPYQVHEQTYGMCPLFLFDTPKAARDYLHESIYKFHAEWSMEWFDKQQTWWGLLETKAGFLYFAMIVLAPFPLLVPLLAYPWWRGRNLRGPLLLLAIVWLVTQLTIWNWPHYIAPIAPVLLLVAVYGLRNVRAATREWTWSPLAVKLIVAAQVAVFVSSAVAWVTEPAGGWHHYKAAYNAYLEEQPGKHLVLVGYSPMHHPHEEWVYNAADLDGSRVLWAHSMSPTENAELLEYFGDRQVWRLAADLPKPRLARYQQPDSELQLVGATGGP